MARLQFGTPETGLDYRVRPTAFGLVFHDGKLACVRVERGDASYHDLPVDFIKIDGAFVRNLDSDAIDRAMVEAINNIGHVMGIKTIAEFVETEAVADELRRMGVDYAQGYWVGRPEPMDAL